jgi:hypothetical protein
MRSRIRLLWRPVEAVFRGRIENTFDDHHAKDQQQTAENVAVAKFTARTSSPGNLRLSSGMRDLRRASMKSHVCG